MPTANEALFDALVRHQTYLVRYSGHVRNLVNRLLDRTEPAIVDLLRAKDGLVGYDTPNNVRRLQALLEALAGLREQAWTDAGKELRERLRELGEVEAASMQGILQTVSPVQLTTVLPGPQLLRAIATARPFEGRLLKDWVQNLASDDIRRVHAAVQMGMVSGEPMRKIVSRVVGTEAFAGVTQGTRNAVDAIVRTAVMHVANNARDAFMQANSDIVVSERYVATLDGRTTPVCKAHDGKIFPVGKGPRPPLHIRCRSLRTAVMNAEVLGDRPSKPVTERLLVQEFTKANGLPRASTRADLPRGTRGKFDAYQRKRIRQLTGPVPAASTYQTWLMRQTKAFQEDTLGVAKAKLFREGGLRLDQFVAANGTELTLAELARKHASAFRAAGLDPVAF